LLWPGELLLVAAQQGMACLFILGSTRDAIRDGVRVEVVGSGCDDGANAGSSSSSPSSAAPGGSTPKSLPHLPT
jgi:hypothetical protein